MKVGFLGKITGGETNISSHGLKDERIIQKSGKQIKNVMI
jgi:hypothetical protein